ncbi:MAG: hypothetical protein KC800_07235, partial [Candidatus Eremiobacteraeota bacterium]|nr:hypothetical protein [Candidatus Eremiobacteraeota bacterium]
MKLLRRIWAIVAILLCLATHGLADENSKRRMLEQTLSYWQQGNLDGIVSLIRNDFQGALLAVGEAPTVVRSSNSTDDEIKSAVFAANILARVGAMTAESGGEAFYHLLDRNLILMDASAWNGTPLEGPGPEFDSQRSGDVIAFYDRLGAYSQVTLFSRLVRQTATLSFPSSPELERYKVGLEITRHFGNSHLGLLAQSREKLEQILGQGGHDPKTEYGIRFCLVLIGRQVGDQELVSKNLESLGALAQKHQVFHSKTEQSLAAFSLVTFKYELDFSQRPEPLRDFLGNHAGLWNHLNQSVPAERETLGTIGFLPVIMASEYWATEVTRRYCDPNLTEEEKSYLSDALKHENIVLAKWRDSDLTTTHTTEELANLNWEAICGFPYWNLAIAREARRQGNLQLAEFMLKGAETECNNVGGIFV